jgi:tetratricopeptide (TPR) repeat protein
MTPAGQFWVCGHHPQPVVLPVAPTAPPAHLLTPLVEELPTPLALPVAEYVREPNPFVALHRLTDAAELITRFFAIVALSDVHANPGGVPAALHDELLDKLARPTFGAWRGLAESALRALDEAKRPCFVVELTRFWHDCWRSLVGGNDGDRERHLLALRNGIAHGARLPDGEAEALLAKHRGPFLDALRRMSFLTGYRLVAAPGAAERPVLLRGLPHPSDWSLPRLPPGQCTSGLAPRRVYLLRDGAALPLFPLHAYDVVLLWREEDQQFRQADRAAPLIYLRYNEDRELLEFTALAPRASFAQHGSEFRDAFLAAYPLPAWRRQREEAERRTGEKGARDDEWQRGGYAFRDLLRAYPDELVGREGQLRQAEEWVRGHGESGGVLWVGGKPGVGKSAFMAGLSRCLKRARGPCVVLFFFRNGDARCHPDHFFRAAVLRLTETFGLDVPDPREVPAVQFARALEAARRRQDEGAGPSVVFLLDGLDEVAEQHPGFVRLPAAHNHPRLLWLCAGRGEPPLTEAFAGADRLWPDGDLPPLTPENVRELIVRECGRLRYSLFARDEAAGKGAYRNAFIDRLAARSEGLPLYVRLVVEDLNAGRLSVENENDLPDSLQAYFERVLERLKVGDAPRVLTEVVAVLCLASEAMTEDALLGVIGVMRPLASELRTNLSRALQYGHVMLRRVPTPEGGKGWLLYYDAFRQHLRTTATIRDTRTEALASLLLWCGCWGDHRDPYALRNYAGHLAEAGRRCDVYALARNEDYLRVQADVLASEPEAPLRTVRAALATAAADDDAGMMAEFCVSHAHRLTAITRESPLSALRGGSPERASRLADMADPECRVLWYLLLAWELSDTGRVKEARAALDRLLQRPFPRAGRNRGKAAAMLLAWVAGAERELAAAMSRKVLGSWEDLQAFAEELARSHYFPAAFDAAFAIRSEHYRTSALVVLAGELAAAGHWADALGTAAMLENEVVRARALAAVARPRAGGREREALRAAIAEVIATACAPAREPFVWLLAAIAEAQAGAGKFADALETVCFISSDEARSNALAGIGQALARSGEREAARGAFAEARSAAHAIGPGWNPGHWNQALALATLAEAEASAGEFADALEHARVIGDEATRVTALAGIGQKLVAAGRIAAATAAFAEALDTARAIQYDPSQVGALAAIAQAWARVGDRGAGRTIFAEAVAPAQAGKSEVMRVRALVTVAQAHAERGDLGAARMTLGVALGSAHAIAGGWERGGALDRIARGQARIGEFTEALHTARAITVKPQRANTLADIGQLMAKAGDRPAACAAFAEALEGLRREEGRPVFDLLRVVRAMAETGELAAALGAVRGSTSKLARAEGLAAVARGQAEAGEREAARATFAEALANARADEWNKPRALTTIAEAQAAAGEFAAALETSRSIARMEERVKALAAVAQARSRAGERAAAQANFAEALADALAAPDDYSRVKALAALAEAQAGAGEFAAAVATARAVNSLWMRSRTLAHLGEAQAAAGHFADAQATFTAALADARARMTGDAVTRELTYIALSQARAGLGDSALETAQSILADRAGSLVWIADALAEAGNRACFKRLLIPAAESLADAFHLGGCLALLYPEQAAAILRALLSTPRSPADDLPVAPGSSPPHSWSFRL